MVSTIVEQSLKCREVGFEMAIHWYRVAEGPKFRRICSQDSYCIGFYLSGRRCKFGFNVHITVPDSFCACSKTTLHRASVHTDTNGDFGPVSVKAILHETIRNDDFLRNTALQHCCDIVSNGCNIVPALQRCVALKIVVANRRV